MAGAAFTAGETLFLVRALGANRYGTFAIALTVGALITLPATFGLPLAIGRFVADHRADANAVRAIIRRGLSLQIGASVIAMVALFACAGLLARLYGHPALGWAFRWVAVSLFGSTLLVFFLNNFTALRHSAANWKLAVAESASETLATVILVSIGLGVAGAALGRAIGYTVGAAAGIVLMVRFLAPWGGRTTRAAPVAARTLIRYAGALFVVDSAYTALTQVDVLMISALLTAGAVGQFGAVLRLLILLSYVGQAVAGGVSPRLARGGGAVPDVRLFDLSLRGLVVFQGMIVAPMLVWAHPIVTLLLGPGYQESVGVMRALAPSAFLLAFSSLTSIGANYLGLAGRRVPISAGTLLFGIILTYILLKAVGLLGAAIADDVVLGIYVGAHLWICHRAVTLDLASLRRSFARTVLAGLVMSIPLLIAGTGHLSPLRWILGGVAGVTAFAATLMLSGELSRSELRAIIGFIRTRVGAADRGAV
jgi:O-antigen/teichoic acid export membrane protein